MARDSAEFVYTVGMLHALISSDQHQRVMKQSHLPPVRGGHIELSCIMVEAMYRDPRNLLAVLNRWVRGLEAKLADEVAWS